MKIDYISCTKMLYFAEKVLNDNIEIYFGGDSFARQFGMTGKEVSKIYRQFEHEKLVSTYTMSVEGEDEFGEMNSEYDIEPISIDKTKFKEFIDDVKSRHLLRDKPILPREAVMSIAKQIEETLKKDEVILIVSGFSSMFPYLEDGTYTLTDFLFRHSYATRSVKPLSKVLSEFLNPIHYNIENKEKSQKLFEYIDNILCINTSDQDYEEWIKEVKKYRKNIEGQTSNVISDKFYITKDGDDFLYKGKHMNLSESAKYYKVFCSLFAIVPKGGEANYTDLIKEVRNRMPGLSKEPHDTVLKFIQNNLTGKKNGFMRYANIPPTEDNGKALIKVIRGRGILFNNIMG